MMIKSLKRSVLAVVLLFTITQVSCDSNDDSNTDCEDAICTAIFVRIMVTIADENQDPVALDSFKVIDLENGNEITISLSPSELEGLQEFGQYPLIEDGILGENEELQVQFQGFINEQEVVNSNYNVSTDCCHVGLDSGNLELTL